MKKLMFVCAVLACAVSANAECIWSTWFDDGAKKDVHGCVLGLASEVKSVSGAQIDICISKAKAVKAGCQYAIVYNCTDTLKNGVQLALWNAADSAALQLGLLNFNKTGFLPFFPFFNFDVKMFGKGR